MELWVRSQDKKLLMKCDRLKAEENYHLENTRDGLREKFSFAVWCNDIAVGNYETEQRCIEIINEIQSLMGAIHPACGDGDVIVYNLPLE